jgi:hypothetical protein
MDSEDYNKGEKREQTDDDAGHYFIEPSGNQITCRQESEQYGHVIHRRNAEEFHHFFKQMGRFVFAHNFPLDQR